MALGSSASCWSTKGQEWPLQQLSKAAMIMCKAQRQAWSPPPRATGTDAPTRTRQLYPASGSASAEQLHQVTSLPCLHFEDTEGGQEPLGTKGREPKAQNWAQAAMQRAASSPSLLATNQTPTQVESKAPDLPVLVLEHPGRAHLSPARHRIGPELGQRIHGQCPSPPGKASRAGPWEGGSSGAPDTC